MTYRFCLIYVSMFFTATALYAQDETTLFRYYEKGKPPADMVRATQKISERYTEEIRGGYYYAIPAEADTFLVYYVRIENELHDEYLPWMVIKRIAAENQLWMLSPDQLGELSFISRFKIQESGIVVHKGRPILWFKHHSQHHSVSGYRDEIYALEPDTVKYLGNVPGFHNIDNESDEFWPWSPREFAQSDPLELSPVGPIMNRHVALRTAFSDFSYTERYLVDNDTVSLYTNSFPDYLISYYKADSLLQATLDDYYSDTWKEIAQTEEG